MNYTPFANVANIANVTKDTTQGITRVLSVDEMVAMLVDDLALATEAGLAAMLTEIFLADPNPLHSTLEPLIRAELGRRRLLTAIQSLADAA